MIYAKYCYGMRYIMISVLFLMLAAGLSPNVNATARSQAGDVPELTGSWSGKLTVGTVSMNIVFNFTEAQNGVLVCTMDSPDQSVKGIPAEVEKFTADSLIVSVPAIGASFSGTFDRNPDSGSILSVFGNFSQSGTSFPLELRYGKPIILRPQTPVPPFPYRTEEVFFANGDTVLAGTLSYPVGYDFESDAQVPVVLMVTGSGQQNRDEELFNHKPFLVIADYFARNGIATLRYDDRGVGASAGDPASVTVQSNMEDALAGLRYLDSLGRFGRVGVLGHSEGGTIAFMLGGKGEADFIISLAGAAVSGKEILVRQNRTALLQAGMPEQMTDDYCTVLADVLDYRAENVRPGEPVGNAGYILDSLAKSSGADLPDAVLKNLETILSGTGAWVDSFVAYDPAEDIGKIACPVFALNGSLDAQVDADMNLSALRDRLPENGGSVIKEYPGLNHLFQHCTTGNPSEYGTIIETVSRQVLKDMAAFITK